MVVCSLPDRSFIGFGGNQYIADQYTDISHRRRLLLIRQLLGWRINGVQHAPRWAGRQCEPIKIKACHAKLADFNLSGLYFAPLAV